MNRTNLKRNIFHSFYFYFFLEQYDCLFMKFNYFKLPFLKLFCKFYLLYILSKIAKFTGSYFVVLRSVNLLLCKLQSIKFEAQIFVEYIFDLHPEI